MEKTYNPHQIEQHWYHTWEKNHYFVPATKGAPYCIMIPPPNVTGSLHMGHGFQYTLMDILIRYHRMKGDNTLWQPGTDHAGIATQMVVERQLLMKGTTRQELGREEFVKKAWEWKQESGGTITQQFRRLGISVDWSRERFTMDDQLSRAVREVFIRLYNEGLIYKGTRLVNWDPKLHTAISDLEVVSNEEDGKLWHIRYPLLDKKDHIVVATTRPETLLGDVAVAVHPDDERYKDLMGKHVQLPLTERIIPIIADEFVDKEFGSGAVKITPGHDFNDYAFGQRHNLAPINIFSPDAALNENVPKKYQGLDRFVAREKIVKDLQDAGLLEKVENYKIKIPRGDRSGVVVEPYLTQQWFMKMKPLAEPAIAAVEKGDIKFIPENWSKTYFQWLHNIEDWCISRQLWWGHRIPIWYDNKGNAYAGHNEEAIRQENNLAADVVLTQETDVLDTWFSAGLWPFSTLGWPEQTKDLLTFYPTNVLVTGFDIIFFWVARMIMMGLKFTNQVPFREVFITGLIRDSEGQKMSKSKGNILDPLDLIDGINLDDLIRKRTYGLMQPAMAQKIEESTRDHFPKGIAPHGTDALRFTLCSFASYGREIRFDMSRLEGYRNFCNKLWNAARYVMMNTEEKNITNTDQFSLPDRWILSRLQQTIIDMENALKNYRFDLFAQAIYEFTWNEFCDWYLELSKPILTSTDNSEEQRSTTRHTLLTVLETILRLLHPVMPFITEEIWQRVAPLLHIAGTTIMLQPFPRYQVHLNDPEAEKELEWVKNVVIAIRTVRSEMNIAPSKPISIIYNKGTTTDRHYSENNAKLIESLARLDNARWLFSNETPPESAMTLVGELEILIPMAGLIDKKEESDRLNREIAKLSKEAQRIETKLQNVNFVDRAPQDVVTKERDKLEELKTSLNKLETQLEKIVNL